MDYENVLGERKFPTYEQLKTGLLQLIDEGKISREDASRLLPELRESEDERARKAALEGIEYLERELGWDAIGDTDILDVKEYLEKQKEQKHVEVRTPTDEEIEEARKQLHKFKVFVVKMADKHQVCFSYDHDFEWDNFCGEILYYLNGNQKPVEWSEEDDRRIDAICELLENTSAIHPNYSHRKLIIWLKSLRPSWKPSDEQIFYLSKAIKTLGEEGDCKTVAILNEIRLEIKKL